MGSTGKPLFWRDPRMPQVELRKVEDGRAVCYAPHTHKQWSLGAITKGQSTFAYRSRRYQVRAGTLVFMNPDWVHACNPIDDQPWAYLMLYVDTPWLAALRHELGLLDSPNWQDLAQDRLECPDQFQAFQALAACLLDPEAPLMAKQSQLIGYLSELMPVLAAQPGREDSGPAAAPERLRALAAYLDQHCAEDLSLDALSAWAGCTPGRLIRAFKQHFGLTPHAYLINRRVQLGQSELKRGTPIAEAALNAGFSDQPHFQRVFKRLVAATPGQYQKPSAEKQ